MKTLTISILLLLSSHVLSQNNLMIDGTWMIDSFKKNNANELVMGDGRDLWQFENGIWNIYSSGKKVSTANIQLSHDLVTVNKSSQRENMKVVYIHGDTYLQLRTSHLTYNLIRVEQSTP